MYEPTDREFAALMVEVLGARGAVTVTGWAVLWGLTGTPDPEDILERGLGSLTTRYRVLAQARQVKKALVARGWVLSDEDSVALDAIRRAAAHAAAH